MKKFWFGVTVLFVAVSLMLAGCANPAAGGDEKGGVITGSVPYKYNSLVPTTEKEVTGYEPEIVGYEVEPGVSLPAGVTVKKDEAGFYYVKTGLQDVMGYRYFHNDQVVPSGETVHFDGSIYYVKVETEGSVVVYKALDGTEYPASQIVGDNPYYAVVPNGLYKYMDGETEYPESQVKGAGPYYVELPDGYKFMAGGTEYPESQVEGSGPYYVVLPNGYKYMAGGTEYPDSQVVGVEGPGPYYVWGSGGYKYMYGGTEYPESQVTGTGPYYVELPNGYKYMYGGTEYPESQVTGTGPYYVELPDGYKYMAGGTVYPDSQVEGNNPYYVWGPNETVDPRYYIAPDGTGSYYNTALGTEGNYYVMEAQPNKSVTTNKITSPQITRNTALIGSGGAVTSSLTLTGEGIQNISVGLSVAGTNSIITGDSETTFTFTLPTGYTLISARAAGHTTAALPASPTWKTLEKSGTNYKCTIPNSAFSSHKTYITVEAVVSVPVADNQVAVYKFGKIFVDKVSQTKQVEVEQIQLTKQVEVEQIPLPAQIFVDKIPLTKQVTVDKVPQFKQVFVDKIPLTKQVIVDKFVYGLTVPLEVYECKLGTKPYEERIDVEPVFGDVFVPVYGDFIKTFEPVQTFSLSYPGGIIAELKFTYDGEEGGSGTLTVTFETKLSVMPAIYYSYGNMPEQLWDFSPVVIENYVSGSAFDFTLEYVF